MIWYYIVFMLNYVVVWYMTVCYSIVCYVMLCYVLLCYVTYVMLYYMLCLLCHNIAYCNYITIYSMQ